MIFLDKEDEVTCYCFDNAVTIFGAELEDALGKVEGKTEKAQEQARQRILARWIPERSAGEAKQFRDPARSIV